MSVTTSRSILSEGNAAALAALRTALGGDSSVSTRELDRMALAVDASHYLHAPDAGFAAYMRGLRDQERVPFDQFAPPADGGRAIADVVIHRP